MQKISPLASTSNGPVILIAPLVGAHDKESHRFHCAELVGGILKQVVIPTQSRVILVEFSGWTEVDVADLAPRARVSANGDDQALPSTRCVACSVHLHSCVVSKRATQKNVVPRCDREHGDVDIRKVF